MIAVAGEALVDVHLGAGAIRAYPGGGPFNTAVCLGRLGVPVSFAGALSSDALGTLLRRALAAAGVDTTDCRTVGVPTPLAIVEPAGDGDVAYRFYLRGTAFECLPALRAAGKAAAVVGSLALALDPPGVAVERFGIDAARGCALVVDPNVRPALMGDRRRYVRRFERVAAAAAVVKLSRVDAAWLYPGATDDDVADRLLEVGAACVVVTRGAAGATARTRSAAVDVSAPQVTVVDTVGAGDAFTAGLVAWLWRAERLAGDQVRRLEESELEVALSHAAAVAAAQCTRASAWGPTAADAMRAAEHHARSSSRRSE